MAANRLPDPDFQDEEPTPTIDPETMAELMETLRSPGIETPTSGRPTRPMRPLVLRKEEVQ